MVVCISLGSRQRISTSCARIFSIWLCFKAGLSLWRNSVLSAHSRFFSYHVDTMSVFFPRDLRRGMAELWNPASLGTEMGAGLKWWGSSVHLHEKRSACLWNFNNDLDSTYRFLVPVDSHRATAGTQFISLVLVVSFLILDSVSASEPFPSPRH